MHMIVNDVQLYATPVEVASDLPIHFLCHTVNAGMRKGLGMSRNKAIVDSCLNCQVQQ